MSKNKSELRAWHKRMWAKYHKGEPYIPYDGKPSKKKKKKHLRLNSKDLSIRDKLKDGADYKVYFKSTYWRKLRAFTLEKRGNKCECCSISSNLQVHHKTYTENGVSILFKEKQKHLMVLCEPCHSKSHYYGYAYKFTDNNEELFSLIRALPLVDDYLPEIIY